MAYTPAVRPVGPTYALSVGSTQTASVPVSPVQGDSSNLAEFYNSGTTQVCVVVSPYATPATTPTLVFPVSASSTSPTVPNSFMLPGGMSMPRAVAVPANGFCFSAIAGAAGPVIVYCTPIAAL